MLQLTLFNNVHSALFRNKSIEKISKSSCCFHIKKKEKKEDDNDFTVSWLSDIQGVPRNMTVGE